MMLSRLACILIHVYARQVAAAHPAAARHRMARERPQTGSGVVRVLVAEDDKGLGEVMARGLRKQGYIVDLVPDGETAAVYLRFYSYEVAVLAGAGVRIETVRGVGYRVVVS
jgi:hypothetical protein